MKEVFVIYAPWFEMYLGIDGSIPWWTEVHNAHRFATQVEAAEYVQNKLTRHDIVEIKAIWVPIK